MTRSDAERQVEAFLAKYDPGIAAQVQHCRRKIRALIPRGIELVYDNYNALVFGFGPSEHASDAVLSIAAYPRWITLFFLRGAQLTDPKRILQGSGKRVRGIRLSGAEDLERSEVVALVFEAVRPLEKEFAAAKGLRTVVKSVSAKQRLRRPSQVRTVRPTAK